LAAAEIKTSGDELKVASASGVVACETEVPGSAVDQKSRWSRFVS
jgi:hypothetical protein